MYIDNIHYKNKLIIFNLLLQAKNIDHYFERKK